MTIDSDKILHDLLNSLDSLEGIRPEEIPNIALYMDQVTTFMDAQLASSRRFESDTVPVALQVPDQTHPSVPYLLLPDCSEVQVY